MPLIKEFKEFALKGNVMDLAVGVVIGKAFADIVAALVSDLIMPIANAVIPGNSWDTFTVTSLKLPIGHLVGSVMNFFIIAGVLFLVVSRLLNRVMPKAPAPPKTKACAECLENIPLEARRCRACTAVVTSAAALLVLWLAPGAARGADPKYEFGKTEELKKVEWKVQAKGGLLLTSGNSQGTSGSFALAISRRDTWNKLSGDAAFAYARSSVITPLDANGNKLIDPGEDARVETTTANNWLLKARYDRFFTLRNSAYLSAGLGADPVAGKELFGGGQIGYSRQLYKTDVHEFVAELGYDFSYEKYVAGSAGTPIHSARAFVGYTGTIGIGTTAYWNLEALLNLNSESAPNAEDGSAKVDPLQDTRVIGKLGAASTFYKNCSIGLGITVKYDHNPAPRPALSLPYAPGYSPFAEKLDTTIEAALIVNLI